MLNHNLRVKVDLHLPLLRTLRSKLLLLCLHATSHVLTNLERLILGFCLLFLLLRLVVDFKAGVRQHLKQRVPQLELRELFRLKKIDVSVREALGHQKPSSLITSVSIVLQTAVDTNNVAIGQCTAH